MVVGSVGVVEIEEENEKTKRTPQLVFFFFPLFLSFQDKLQTSGLSEEERGLESLTWQILTAPPTGHIPSTRFYSASARSTPSPSRTPTVVVTRNR